MNSKITLLALSIVAVGLFAMPSTLSLLTGQHTFYGGNAYSGADAVQCKNCHANVQAELVPGKPHAALTDCKGCHTDGSITVNATQGGGGGKYGGKGATHAAKINECIVCHTAVPSNITATGEAHTPMYANASIQSNVGLTGKDEACVACHTAAGKTGNVLNMTASKLFASATVSGSTYIVKYKLQ